MEKNEFHAVLKYLHMKGLTPKEIKAELDNVHICTSVCDCIQLDEFKRTWHVAVHPHVMHLVRDVQLRLEIIDKISTILF